LAHGIMESMDDPQDSAGRGDPVVRRWGPAIGFIGIVIAFLVTRLPYLDADIPVWELTQYSPIDEFGYTVPAFNLVHYGTWVHQAAPWAPVEGLPMNVVENVAAAISMSSVGYDYWGLRASSIAFGLLAFLCMAAIVRRQVVEAQRVAGVPSWLALAVTSGAVVLLLADFSFILSARIIEPTVTRLAVAAAVVYLVSRGMFLGERHGLMRSGAFGVVIGAAVIFVYIYNLFLLPAALASVAWWAFRSGGWSTVARQATAFLVGVLAIWAIYFALVLGIYGQTPLDWYRVWIGSFAGSARASGISIDKALTVLNGNIFRLDPTFLGLFLASLPVFVWSLVRRPSPTGVLIGSGLIFLVAQTAVVADYPARKGLMLLPFALPIAMTGILLLGPFREWLGMRRWRLMAAGVWLVVALAITLLETPLRPVPAHGTVLAMIVAGAGVVGVVAIAIVAVARRIGIVLPAMATIGLAVLAPLLYADAAFVYRHATFTYRDAQVEVRPVIDGQLTAGGWSFGMQLYNTSRPVVNGYFYGMSRSDYEHNVVRMFAEGRASSLFAYVNAGTRSHLESLGFRLVDTYDILLPRGQILGRYVFAPNE
jgi:hypothetical protein